MVKAYLPYIAVNPRIQNQGIGTSLVKRVEQYVISKGAGEIVATDVINLGFFQSLGYSPIFNTQDWMKKLVKEEVSIPEGFEETLTQRNDIENLDSAISLTFIYWEKKDTHEMAKAKIGFKEVNNG